VSVCPSLMAGQNKLERLSLTSFFRLVGYLRARPGVNVIKHFAAVIYGFFKYARVFVPGRHFQPSLLFVGKTKRPTQERST
jgi:hypothetical protein